MATKQFTYVSQQAEQFLGYPVEQWYDEGFWEAHIYPEDREETVHYCVAQAERKLDHQFRYRMIKADGDIIWVHDVVSVIDDPLHGRLMRGLLFDASRYEDVQRAIMRKKEAAERATHTQAEYLEQMSHRFETQLRPMLHATDQLIEDGLTDSQLQAVQSIRTHTESQLQLVDELVESLDQGKKIGANN